ncbi:MAG TPA: DnaJ domain-containing protein [Acetobacteraceae bacterium]|nr:DnaJ domain-containing protein [Acetobacteraceae bacterium]
MLARAGVSQAGFARLTGLTARQVNNWCRGRAAVPPWDAALAVLLEERSPEAITMLVDETTFAWHETLGVSPVAETDAIRLAMRRLALRYHPDQGGTEAQMTRINAAYEQARTTPANRPPVQGTPPPRP